MSKLSSSSFYRRCRYLRCLCLMRYEPLLVCSILAVHLALLSWSIPRQAPTADEPLHLIGGLRLLESGQHDADRGNPPLFGLLAAIPVYLAGAEMDWSIDDRSFEASNLFLNLNGSRSFYLTALGRWAQLAFPVLAGFVCWKWARDLSGREAGIAALFLWAFCPLALDFGQLIKGDMPCTSLGLLCCYSFWRWLNSNRWIDAFWSGAFLGLTLLTKYVMVILFVIFPVWWLIHKLLHSSSRRYGIVQLLFILLIAIDGICLFYINRLHFSTAGHYRAPHILWSKIDSAKTKLPSFISQIPVLLPEEYVLGVDAVAGTAEHTPVNYMKGKWKPGKWKTFYLNGLFIKMPLVFWAYMSACLAGALLAVRRSNRRTLSDVVAIALPSSLLLAFVTVSSSHQFVRYALPALPFVIILPAALPVDRSSILTWVKRCLLIVYPISTLIYYPHLGSYFNQYAGGPQNGHSWFIDNSIDWGQDLLYLKQYLNENPEVEDLKLLYFGRIDPRYAGIEFRLPARNGVCSPLRILLTRGQDKFIVEPGWYAVSVSIMRGAWWQDVHDGMGNLEVNYGADFMYFLKMQPVSRAGYSINIYHVTEPFELDPCEIQKMRVVVQ